MLLKVMADVYVNTDDILMVLPYQSSASKNIYSNAKKNSQLIDLTKGKAVKSIFILENQYVIAVSNLVGTLMKKIE